MKMINYLSISCVRNTGALFKTGLLLQPQTDTVDRSVLYTGSHMQSIPLPIQALKVWRARTKTWRGDYDTDK